MKYASEASWPIVTRARLFAVVVTAIALLAGACGDEDPSGPDPASGSIVVVVSTSGEDPDPDGYSVTVGDSVTRTVAANDSAEIAGIDAGDYPVAIAGLSANCSLEGDAPTQISVSVQTTTRLELQIGCVALVGSVLVRSSTDGEDLDPNGYFVALDDGGSQPLATSDTVTLQDVPVGRRKVALTGLRENCSATEPNPVYVDIAFAEVASVNFVVTCEFAPKGVLEVTTRVTNNFDPNGYGVVAAGDTVGRVQVEGTMTFGGVFAGSRQVELLDVAPNCRVEGIHPVSVEIPEGGVGSADFSIVCTNPPGGRIAYVGYVDGLSGLVTMNADGTGKLRIRGPAGSPAWSPDGSALAFTLRHDDRSAIHTARQDGSDLQRLTTPPAGGVENFPRWSPDGSRIVFSRRNVPVGQTGEDDVWRIYVMNADGSGLTLLSTDAEADDIHPGWSPDGSRIVFSRLFPSPAARGARGIFVMNSDGSNVELVTDHSHSQIEFWTDEYPTWSPDGSRIVFQRLENGVRSSYTVRPDGSRLARLRAWPEGVAPSWSPDGTGIVFRADSVLYTMNADGGDLTKVADDLWPSGSPNWGP